MIELNVNSTVSGLYKIDVIKKDGVISSSGWFKNLITDGGMDRRAANTDYLNYCQVGSGSSTPSYSDTSLSNLIASSNTQYSVSTGAAASSPYYVYITKTFSFPAGVATGNISEVGVGWATSGSLFSRALIVDGSGNPTSITVLSDEELRVTYQFRIYIPLNDISGSVVLGGITYNYTGRASQATTYAHYTWSTLDVTESVSHTSSTHVSVYNGSIGEITSSPSGTSAGGATSQIADPYIKGSFTVAQTTTWGSTIGNVSGGISAIMISLGCGKYQFGFSPAIPKRQHKSVIPKNNTLMGKVVMIPGNSLSSQLIQCAFIGGRAFPVAKDADYEIGGKELNDPSEGINYQVWRCRLINDDVVLYDEQKNATTIYTGADISEISFSFDRNMNIALAFVQGGESKFYWYDSNLGAMTVTNFGSSVITPRVSHDDKRDMQSASSDVILAYVKNSSLYFRMQRDRYQTEYLLKSGDCKGLIKIGMNSKLRLQFLLEW